MKIYSPILALVAIGSSPKMASAASGGLRKLQLGPWAYCSSSSECGTGCCSGQYSNGELKCTPLDPGFDPVANGCVSSEDNSDDSFTIEVFPSPGPMCSAPGLKSLAGTTCYDCCNGNHWEWNQFSYICN